MGTGPSVFDMSGYIPTPEGMPRKADIPNMTHGGSVQTEHMHSAVCPCGFNGPWRCSPGDAHGDLLDHYRKNGTLVEIDERDDFFKPEPKKKH